MPHDLTHASFFSGVGGLDLGLERAGWRTVSFSEIDPYASAVLAERWPGVPNLGDIVRLAAGVLGDGDARGSGPEPLPDEIARAVLWSGGFPCQDLSVAGKRAGFAGERSSLAFAFLDLVERHRPPAILLENVPGLLSSNAGRDLGSLLGRLGELGYWWAYRILDAQFFGVPQRRRRVFICALHADQGFGADSPAEVLSVGARCDGHSAAGDEAGEGASGVLADGARSTRTVQSAFGHHGWTLGAQDADGGYLQLSPSPDPGGVANALRASDGHHGHSSPRGDGGDNLVADTRQEESAQRSSVRRLTPTECERLMSWPDGWTIVGNWNGKGNPSVEPRYPREADGVAGRVDGGEWLGFSQNQRGEVVEHPVAHQLTTGGGKPGEGYPAVYRKSARVSDPGTPETWVDDGLANTLNSFDVGDVRTTHAVISPMLRDHLRPEVRPNLRVDEAVQEPHDSSERSVLEASQGLLPLGLDSHRYRCCGNGVVSNVAEWIGVRLARAMTETQERAA